MTNDEFQRIGLYEHNADSYKIVKKPMNLVKI